MIADHIKYLKSLIETKITMRDGTGSPLAARFFEVYPDAATISKSLPCAALRHLPGKNSFHGGYDRSVKSGDEIAKVRKLYDAESLYQVDFYSKDVYDFIERDGTYLGYLNQFVKLLVDEPRFPAADGSYIESEPGAFGVIDDETLITDGIKMAYCRVLVHDGVYKSETVPAMPGDIENFHIEV
ncbi:MAG: hypothetical protein EPN93_17470 [Spirochaetes bacterium]|nr:MAG: hypothetical protein EPN93_17470 [Spirochaetota bacterium]